METSRNGEIRLEGYRKLVEDALTSGRGVSNEDASFGRVVDAVGSVDKLAHLE